MEEIATCADIQISSSVLCFKRSQLWAFSASSVLSFECSQLWAFSALTVLSFDRSQLRAFSPSSVLIFGCPHNYQFENSGKVFLWKIIVRKAKTHKKGRVICVLVDIDVDFLIGPVWPQRALAWARAASSHVDHGLKVTFWRPRQRRWGRPGPNDLTCAAPCSTRQWGRGRGRRGTPTSVEVRPHSRLEWMKKSKKKCAVREAKKA